MACVLLKRVVPAASRSFSSYTKLWDLFSTPKVPAAKPVAPQYMMNMRDNLEFALERMRLARRPFVLQLLNQTARLVKKVGK
ncbi:hypothetical protein CCR75_001591 [Bremia lactucae]|uniref:Uncharacterized protein n=1 Tax=Bremia lactucae TaxID=4779 RepID=A0A976FHN1_BRELC|nr:hypothetical protein CCR75_001591 [Bremia lactucae]